MCSTSIIRCCQVMTTFVKVVILTYTNFLNVDHERLDIRIDIDLECLHHDYSTFYNSVNGVLKPGKVLLDEENMVVHVSDSGSQFFFLSLFWWWVLLLYVYICIASLELALIPFTSIMEKLNCFLFLLCVSPLVMLQFYMASLVIAAVPNFTTDQSALLALKAQISYDPHNVLTNNWSTSFSICKLVGITCGSNLHRVIALNLSYMDLVGTIPPHVGNLSFLVSLNIKNNSFHGSIPNELSHLYRFQHLSFGFNDFSEKMPSWMGLLSKLQNLFLYGNKFLGTIPPSLSNISLLQIIDLSYNQLSGSIPTSIFNIYSLKQIYLYDNMLSGPMPSIISNMSSLQFIHLGANKLYGTISHTLFSVAYRSFRPSEFEARGVRKVTTGITGLWQPSVHSDVAF
jgi:hypothetical protein